MGSYHAPADYHRAILRRPRLSLRDVERLPRGAIQSEARCNALQKGLFVPVALDCFLPKAAHVARGEKWVRGD